MIGKLMTDDEFQEVLRKQRTEDIFREELMAELKGIKLGQCLRYRTPEASNPLLSLSLSMFVSSVTGLKIITEGGYSYVYRE